MRTSSMPPGSHWINTRVYRKNRFDYLVVIDSATELRNLAPDFLLLGGVDTRGVIVTSPSDVGDFDFLSQFFASGSGIDEDPVTGSAH